MSQVVELQSPEVHVALRRVAELDFRHLKRRMCAGTDGQVGWPRHIINEIELEYRRFLTLVAAYPEERISPSPLVDRFWHQHIVDTRRYASDCESAIGWFLHHVPCSPDGDGEQGDIDRTVELYRREFPEGNLTAWLSQTVEPSASDPKTTIPVPSECYGTPEPHG